MKATNGDRNPANKGFLAGAGGGLEAQPSDYESEGRTFESFRARHFLPVKSMAYWRAQTLMSGPAKAKLPASNQIDSACGLRPSDLARFTSNISPATGSRLRRRGSTEAKISGVTAKTEFTPPASVSPGKAIDLLNSGRTSTQSGLDTSRSLACASASW